MPRYSNSERGFSLWITAVSGSVLIGMLGLATDVGRIFIVKNELQAFADASALAACKNLDGTSAGIVVAHNIATSGPLGVTVPNGYEFDAKPITNVTDTYATSFTGTYDSYATASSTTPNRYRFVNVVVSANLPLYFLAVIPGLPTQQAINANSVAGQMALPAIANGGLMPFSPDAHNPSDTTYFGLTPNQRYTLKWGNGNTTTCGGDAGFTPGNAPSEHGYINLGQGDGTSYLGKAIVYGGFPNALHIPATVNAGNTIYDVPGNRASVFTFLASRSNQDTDQTSLTWAQYQAAGIGNGRRIVTAAINDPTRASGNGSNGTVFVIGFGNFLLDPSATIAGSSGVGSYCATYIGPGNLNSASSGGADGTTVYATVLYR